MAETESRSPEQRVESAPGTHSPKAAGNLTGTPLYLRWLSALCAFMALFCVGVLIIGYKDPSFGRVATLVALVVASIVCFWLSKRKTRR